MMRKGVVAAVGVFVGAGVMILGAPGCASRSGGGGAPPVAAQRPPTPMAADAPAYFTLDQIQPVLQLPKPATAPTTQPAPLDALVWFAEAHAALTRGDRNTAINLLEKAVALDPDSPEIYEELGKAY